MIIVFIAVSFAVLFTVNFLTLAVVGRSIQSQCENWDTLVFVTDKTLERLSEFDEKIQNALDCLVSTDARLDEVTNPEGSG